MIEFYLNNFKEAGIAIQITQDVNVPATVHAIDTDGEFHVTHSEIVSVALEMMSRKLLIN